VSKPFDLINPATKEVVGQISLGSAADVDRTVVAARRAFSTFSQTSEQENAARFSSGPSKPTRRG